MAGLDSSPSDLPGRSASLWIETVRQPEFPALSGCVGVDAGKGWIARRLRASKRTPSKLAPGEGALVRIDSAKRAACRDEKGVLHVLSPVCPHMKCLVAWNAAEKSWDCPCHGSRFDIHGRVINGPAVRDLGREPSS